MLGKTQEKKDEQKLNNQFKEYLDIIKDAGRSSNLSDCKENKLLQTIEKNASDYKSYFRKSLFVGLICINVAVVSFALNVVLHIANSYIIVTEMMLPILSFLILRYVTKPSHKTFIEYRKKAEVLRWSLLFLKCNPKQKNPIDKFDTLKTFTDCVTHEPSFYHTFYITELKPELLQEIKEYQEKYHSDRILQTKERHLLFHTFILMVVGLFLILALTKGFIELGHLEYIPLHVKNHEDILKIINISLIILPSLFATAETILYFMSYKKYHTISEHIIQKLKAPSITTKTLYQILMNEHRDWYEDRSHLEIEGRI